MYKCRNCTEIVQKVNINIYNEFADFIITH